MGSCVKDKRGLELVGHSMLEGAGDLMQIDVVGGVGYVAHVGRTRMGTTIFDARDPRNPKVLSQIETPPGTHSHKVQITDDVMIVNHEKNPSEDASEWSAGVAVFDVSDPARPRRIGFFPATGEGVHRMTFWDMPYAYVSTTGDGYLGRYLAILDLSDPSSPSEVARWSFPGSHLAAGETPTWDADAREYQMHHALLEDGMAFCSWWDGGMVVLDVSDPTRPSFVSHLELDPSESACTHTALPLRDRQLVTLVDESVANDCAEIPKQVRMVDIADPTSPKVVSKFPFPEGDFCARGGRFGPHNVHENRPGRHVDPDTVYLTYFNAGLRVIDVRYAERPTEIAHFVPDAPPGQRSIQLNDLVVTEDGLIFATDRISGGLYVFDRTIATCRTGMRA